MKLSGQLLRPRQGTIECRHRPGEIGGVVGLPGAQRIQPHAHHALHRDRAACAAGRAPRRLPASRPCCPQSHWLAPGRGRGPREDCAVGRARRRDGAAGHRTDASPHRTAARAAGPVSCASASASASAWRPNRSRSARVSGKRRRARSSFSPASRAADTAETPDQPSRAAMAKALADHGGVEFVVGHTRVIRRLCSENGCSGPILHPVAHAGVHRFTRPVSRDRAAAARRAARIASRARQFPASARPARVR